jgi:hypothetical protein
MQSDDGDANYTYNELSNDDKQLLLSNGYIPNELRPDEARELLQDLREESDDTDDDSERIGTIADENDGTEV